MKRILPIKILTRQIVLHQVGNLQTCLLFHCRVGNQAAGFCLSPIVINHGSIMKRSATEGSSHTTKKQKQSSLFDSMSGGSGGSSAPQNNDQLVGAWKSFGEAEKGIKPLLCFTPNTMQGCAKIAAFDMDGCLIVPKSGAKFPKDSNDWKLLSNQVQPKLRTLHDKGYKIVVFTNQAGIEKKKAKESDIKDKIVKIMNTLGIPMQAFVSTGENVYRKPYTGSWDYMEKTCNGGVEIDMKESFFVGDAAGRPKDWIKGRKKDHSCSDRKFAANIGIMFHTPEEFFEGMISYSRFEWRSVNPKSLIHPDADAKKKWFESLACKETEVVLLVGFPASGKSTFAKRYLNSKGYVIVNRDTLKTQEKCERTVAESLKAGKSVAVDNTNPSKEARQAYVKIAVKHGVPVRCFYFDTSIEAAKHMNYYRQLITDGKQRRVPDVGYNVFKSRFVAPDKDGEKFTEVLKIPFVPMFDSDEQKKKFLQWT